MNLVFQSVDTGTCDAITGDSYVIDCDALSESDAHVLYVCDHYATMTREGVAIVRRVGVLVADLWQAYEWRQSLADAGILEGVEDWLCDVMGNGDQPTTSSDGWVWDGNTHLHCDRPSWSSDAGAECSKCGAVMPWDDEPVDEMTDDEASDAYDRYKTID